ncbi:DUF2897 family protein [Vibrio vulnificus]|jgi:hypothetical protein|uniref:DUF2897 domain-containing protein n=3 Tax=Vibrio vulnificus TaxID=672 RepID=A0A1W6M637_VIBVL|nr:MULTISPECIES: DUF2897 family protein [Vibrio]OJI59889.1 hypothetical protein VFL11327_01187 [Vibrio fluvialis]AAO10315.1 hypothetical protein VV1_1914 [Vibrio vulnificus CMCP6]ADV85820.1 hypothetical protein VVMO6_00798 [Vibrio vulnificus MO6-24/O]AIL71282.1 hypothetical protein VV93_v1c22040 [Vibrio vulnificus]ALM70203.1 hypothetical protein FORC9_0686 [Vibrio vulnificus]
MQEILTNPWVISFVVLSVIVGNIAALKYTAKMKIGQVDKLKDKSDLDKLNELDQKKQQSAHNDDELSR